MPLPPE
jgi:hypothetical protein